jgi:hypothetical protein
MGPLALAVLVSGCGSFKAPTYTPDYETLDQLKKLNIEKLSVGKVRPGSPKASINRITLRGSLLTSPKGTFANYLEDAIRSDLIEINFHDDASNIQLNATILQNDIDVSGIGTGYGVMEINLAIEKFGALVLEKIYLANTEFDSSFAGAVAIPKGQSEYPNLVRTLLKKIYNDSAFIDAVKK